VSERAWLPTGSTHYWVFFLGVGAAVAALLAWQGVAAPLIIAAIAVVIGWFAGVVAAAIVRARRGTTMDPSAGPALIGASGTVIAAIPERGVGRVKVKSRGGELELAAEGEYSAAVPDGASVEVVGQGAGGRVLVSRR
jgi:membrane protein implicated in regulation of membrane protease activity